MIRPLASPRRLCIALVATFLTAATASAQTNYYWNAPNGGDGTWDGSTVNWATAPGGPVDTAWVNDGTGLANFGNTAGTVTLSTGFNVHGLVFTTSGYTLDGGALTLFGAGGPISTGANNVTINSVIGDSGGVGLTKTGSGTLTLGGINTYIGPTLINGGTISISGDRGLGAVPLAATAGHIRLNTGTLLATSTFELNAFRGMMIGTGSGGTGTINVASGQTLTYNGIITNNAVASQLNKTGAGTVVLGGSNTYTGGTLLTNGTIILNHLNGLGTGGQQTIAPTGTNDGALLINTTGTFARVVATGALNDTSTGRVVIGSQTGLSGDVTFSSNPLHVRKAFTIQAGATRTIFSGEFRQGGTTVAHITISAPVAATTGARKVVFTNPGTASTYGDITIGDSFGPHAALQFGNGTASGNIVPDSSVINFFQAPDGGGGGSLLILAPGATSTGETIGALNSLASGAGRITTLTPTSGSNPTYTLTVGGGDKSGNFSGIITQGTGVGNAIVAITKIGSGTQILSGANTYTGATTVDGGTLQTAAINTLPSASAVTVGGGGTLDLANNSQVIASLAGSGSVNFGTGSPNFATLTTGGSNASTTFSGVISGTGILTKVGSGTMTLTGNNTFDGNTNVNAGTLLVNGQVAPNSGTGTSSVFVNDGGTFGGNGRAEGISFLVSGGGTIRGGDENAVGTLTLSGTLQLDAGAALAVRVTDASTPSGTPGGSTIGTIPNPTSNNFIHITNGGLDVAPEDIGSLVFRVDGTGTPFVIGQTYSYQIGLADGQDLNTLSITTQAQFIPTGFTSPDTLFSITGGAGGQVYLNISPVPEPATVLGLAAGALAVGGLIRRRVRRA